MTPSPNAFNDIWQANMETAQQYAQLAFDSAERLLGVQADSLRDICDLGGNEYLYFWSGNSGRPLDHLPELVTKRLDFAADITRHYQDAALQIQNAFYHLAEKQMPLLQRNMQGTLAALDTVFPPL